ncbi:hypothetical protein [Salinicola aestuarinus]|nr:hypothetical protein [Salinicola aestuarinus]
MGLTRCHGGTMPDGGSYGRPPAAAAGDVGDTVRDNLEIETLRAPDP